MRRSTPFRCAPTTFQFLQFFAPSRSPVGVTGCSAETGSDAGKVSLRASSSASSWCVRSRVARARLSSRRLRFDSSINSISPSQSGLTSACYGCKGCGPVQIPRRNLLLLWVFASEGGIPLILFDARLRVAALIKILFWCHRPSCRDGQRQISFWCPWESSNYLS
jgi:hypothetical protein